MPKKGTPEYKNWLRERASKGGKNKKGSKHKTTIEREKILEMAKDIVASRTRKLIDTQTVLAVGCIKVFKIRTYYEGSGKNRKKMKSKPELVNDEEEIANALDYEYGEGEDPSNDDEYFFVMTKDPDNTAIEALLNRTFGKATENKNLTIEKGMGELLDELEDGDE